LSLGDAASATCGVAAAAASSYGVAEWAVRGNRDAVLPGGPLQHRLPPPKALVSLQSDEGSDIRCPILGAA